MVTHQFHLFSLPEMVFFVVDADPKHHRSTAGRRSHAAPKRKAQGLHQVSPLMVFILFGFHETIPNHSMMACEFCNGYIEQVEN